MNNQITYTDKVALNDNPLIPDINKCKADDMNEIKSKHNGCMNGSIPMGNVVVDSVRSKNLFNLYSKIIGTVDATYSYITDGIRVTNTNSSTTNNIIRIIAIDITNYIGKTLTLSAYAKSSSTNPACMYMRLAKSDGTTTESYPAQLTSTTTDGTLSVSYTIPSGIGDYHYLLLTLYGTRNQTTTVNSYVDFTNIQIEKGSTATSYSSYQGLGYVSGSNSNGNYIKYDDGTLIQWGKRTSQNVACTTAWGALYRSDWSSGIPFPIEFTEVQMCEVYFLAGTYASFIIMETGPQKTATQPYYIARMTSSTLANVEVGFYAIGRWY